MADQPFLVDTCVDAWLVDREREVRDEKGPCKQDYHHILSVAARAHMTCALILGQKGNVVQSLFFLFGQRLV